MKSLKWVTAYLFVAILGLSSAFFLSMKFLAPAHSQEQPGKGDLPPEFAKEAGAPPAAPVSGPAPAPAPSPSPDTAGKEKVPPPPVTVPAATPAAGMAPAAEAATTPTPAPTPAGAADMNAAASTSAATPTSLLPIQDQYIYDPTSKRDPFKPFSIIQKNAHKHTGQGPVSANTPIKLEPLQEFDIDELQIVGIVWDIQKPKAVIRTPRNEYFTVYKNSKIGRNDGTILAIREGEIVISELKYEEGKTLKGTRIKEIKRDKLSGIKAN